HRYCLAFYREWLKDTKPSGTIYQIERGSLSTKTSKYSSMGGMTNAIKDPAARLDRVESRVCDDIMLHLPHMIVGMPEYHPLLKDAQSRFDQNLKWLNQHQFRHWTSYEANQINSLSLDRPLL